jgi:hypothetical protein
MKKMKKWLLASLLVLPLGACDIMQQSLLNPTGPTSKPLTNEEVIRGLKEALIVGINNATKLTSATDGFLKNPEIFIPFPQEAIAVRDHAIKLGLGAQIDDVITTMNRAAEEASKEAVPIFVDAIRGMSISDGFSILNGGDGAATRFLMERTSNQLKEAFRPKVTDAIARVRLTQLWQPLASGYNATTVISGRPRVTEDLNEYVLDRSIKGLFHMVEKEENKIRKDPAARVSDILVRVFGGR